MDAYVQVWNQKLIGNNTFENHNFFCTSLKVIDLQIANILQLLTIPKFQQTRIDESLIQSNSLLILSLTFLPCQKSASLELVILGTNANFLFKFQTFFNLNSYPLCTYGHNLLLIMRYLTKMYTQMDSLIYSRVFLNLYHFTLANFEFNMVCVQGMVLTIWSQILWAIRVR